MSVTTDVMWLWEVGKLKRWDVNGKHPDPAIENQLTIFRNTFNGSPTLFSGWEAEKWASRWLGTNIDIKIFYRLLEHCDWVTRFSLFIPGKLYKHLIGQPNQVTIRVDERGFERFESLGNSIAGSFVTGLNYKF